MQKPFRQPRPKARSLRKPSLKRELADKYVAAKIADCLSVFEKPLLLETPFKVEGKISLGIGREGPEGNICIGLKIA